MNLLELFAGSKSIGKAAKELGMNVFSSDIIAYDGIDYIVDILNFDYSLVPFVPDIIWASPPCTGFSVASIGTHWGGGRGAYKPKTKTAKLGIKLVQKTLEIINHYNPKFYFIENPRGVLRKLSIMKDLPRYSVTYCQYGDKRMKPTDIWTNCSSWVPKPMCKNGDTCHESAPRGSKTGTQGRANAYERSKIPHSLCLEVLTACIGDDND